jgi:hypothetical protein
LAEERSQKDHDFKASLGNIVRPCLKKQQQNKKQTGVYAKLPAEKFGATALPLRPVYYFWVFMLASKVRWLTWPHLKLLVLLSTKLPLVSLAPLRSPGGVCWCLQPLATSRKIPALFILAVGLNKLIFLLCIAALPYPTTNAHTHTHTHTHTCTGDRHVRQASESCA